MTQSRTHQVRAAVAVMLAGACLAACGAAPAAQAPAAAPATASAPVEAPQPAPAVGSLEWAVAGDWRLPEERARDVWRHPVETLTFFGVKGSDTVVEMFPGGGWYTAILGPYLKAGGGKLYAAHMDPASSDYARVNVAAFRDAFIAKPDVYGDIVLTVASADSPGIAPEGTADVVLTFRNVHNWMMGGTTEKMFADAFRALKPGGVLGVVEHRLPSSREQDPMGRSGYVQEAYVKQIAAEAGFEFVEASEINANPKDTADHPLGVWMLPPNLRSAARGEQPAADYNAETYKAIGESDRMTLKFRKPVPAPQ